MFIGRDGVSHHKGGKALGRENNDIKDNIKRMIINCYRRLSL